MKGRAAVLALLVTLALTPAGATGLRAQTEEEAPARLTLLRQSPVATPTRRLRLSVLATNRGDVEYTNLGLELWLYDPARSRSAYAASLEQEPGQPFLVTPFPVEGTLDPGQPRELSIEMPQLVTRAENALYPMKVQLESNGVPIAVLRSALVFIHERPLVPLNVSLIFVLDEGVHLGPGGEFVDDHLERSVAPGGGLDSVTSSLAEFPVPATLVVSPILLEQLQRMADGYRRGIVEVRANEPPAERAAVMLDRIRALARRPNTEVVPLPFAGPSVPSLVAGGLQQDLVEQMELGEKTVRELLGVQPIPGLFRPPGGLLTAAAVRVLADEEVKSLIVDPQDLPPPSGLVLSPPAVARVRAGLGRTLDAVVPDAVVAQRLSELPEDPRLRARWVIGELTALYFEQPSVDRGVAILVHAGQDRTFVQALVANLQSAIWLSPASATRLLAITGDGELRSLNDLRVRLYSDAFLQETAEARESIDHLESMTEGTSPLSERLQGQVLLAEARDFLRDEPAGLAFLEAVQDRVRREFDKVEPPTPSSVTLTSRGGVIPVTIRNLAGYRVRIRVVLLSPRLEFLEGDSRKVVLDRRVQVFTFPVRAQTTGRFPVAVRLETLRGALIAESQIVVRSTAYNLLALVITLGAALFLAAWWGRRLLSRLRT
ncbi:MAG TPA: DUF6049 family protein [Actinomycetota bacterium]|nr:DUF6049 family protein [Actinomycetota bacterium]